MENEKEILALQNEVKQVIIALDLIAKADHPVTSFEDGYKRVGINFSLEACVIASKMTGYDQTFCKMLNHKFRTDACEMMFEQALAEAGR